MYTRGRTNVECCEQKIKIFNEHQKKSYLVRYRIRQGARVCIALQTAFADVNDIIFQYTIMEIELISYANPKY